MRNSCGVRVTTCEAIADKEAWYMAWIVVVPPSPRHPHERHQVCYQEGKRHRSAGIFPTRRRALAEKRAIERGRDELVKDHEVDLERARTLFGEYVATKWWPAWKDQHPTSEYGTRKKVEKRILPPSGTSRSVTSMPARSAPGRQPCWPSSSHPRRSTPTCRCSGPSSTPPW